jgi:hypothetical protein
MLRAGYGLGESQARGTEVKKTMRNIKFVLTERFYAWEDARKLALTDQEISVDFDNATFNYYWKDNNQDERYMEEADDPPTRAPNR